MKNILLAFTLLMSYYYIGNAQGTNHRFDLDHIIIWTEKDAPERRLFEEKGFTIAPLKMVHTGMGSGGRYIFLFNTLLEFVYPNEQATFHLKYRTLLSYRNNWRKTGQSPFGLAFSMTPYDTTTIPFKTTEVKESWMRPNTSLFFATSNSTNKNEPLVLIVHPTMVWVNANTIEEVRKDIEEKWPAEDEEQRINSLKSFQHANGIQKLTNVKVTCKTNEFSSTIKALENVKNCQVIKGKEHLMEMTFDANRQKKTADFRPQLPIVIKY
jgi:hypothetical protein